MSALKNITLTADEALIERARERAKAEGSTLNESFRKWLAEYARPNFDEARYEETMAAIRAEFVGKPFRKYSREEMNERRY
jgi:hypothetical protein